MPKTNKLRLVEKNIIESYTEHRQTLRTISDFYSVSVGTIRNILIRHGVQLRKRGRRKVEK